MIRASDVCSLSDFRQNAKAHLDRLAKSGSAQVLTVNGQAKGVVMSPETFDELVELARQAVIPAKLKQGLEDDAAGRVLDAREAMKHRAKKVSFKEYLLSAPDFTGVELDRCRRDDDSADDSGS